MSMDAGTGASGSGGASPYSGIAAQTVNRLSPMRSSACMTMSPASSRRTTSAPHASR